VPLLPIFIARVTCEKGGDGQREGSLGPLAALGRLRERAFLNINVTYFLLSNRVFDNDVRFRPVHGFEFGYDAERMDIFSLRRTDLVIGQGLLLGPPRP
jgi:hypothetical protein